MFDLEILRRTASTSYPYYNTLLKHYSRKRWKLTKISHFHWLRSVFLYCKCQTPASWRPDIDSHQRPQPHFHIRYAHHPPHIWITSSAPHPEAVHEIWGDVRRGEEKISTPIRKMIPYSTRIAVRTGFRPQASMPNRSEPIGQTVLTGAEAQRLVVPETLQP